MHPDLGLRFLLMELAHWPRLKAVSVLYKVGHRVLKVHDLITSSAFIVIKAASEFKDQTTAINQLWQTDFTYLKVLDWGLFYLNTILDDHSRYIISWKLCANMRAEDVTDTLDLARALFTIERELLPF